MSQRVHEIRALITSPHRDDFHASVSAASLGDVQVSRLTHSPLTTTRTSRLIRQHDPERFILSLVERGDVAVDHQARYAFATSGQLILMDSHRRWSGTLTPTGPAGPHGRPSLIRHLVVDFPRGALPLPSSVADDLVASPFNVQTGMGVILHHHLRQVLRQADACGQADLDVLRGVTLDLVGALLAHRVDDESVLSPSARRRALTARIHRYIDDNLADPDLSPRRIADAHRISLRYLHKLFQTQETTVSAHIRARRLESCRRELADPRLAHRSVQRIAARWGFHDPSYFSKLFRRTHGLSPADYRNTVLHASACADLPPPCAPVPVRTTADPRR
ncbi:helix-turn-helix domain-containing protein [Actinomadura oligospora]|uniref:helix-turn-helix domain-containing protein n=1 Tax=Actinomadura oligospora TaxID=111804 RepID=UPI0004B0AAFD|nr:helix-turn-helix domain-containing protein [Actinomadura oligospora]